MSEQAPKYHPIVEENIETSGIHAGRVRNIDLAHDLAIEEEAQREVGERIVRLGIQDAETSKNAINKVVDDRLVNSLATAALRKERTNDVATYQAELGKHSVAIHSDLSRINEVADEESQRHAA